MMKKMFSSLVMVIMMVMFIFGNVYADDKTEAMQKMDYYFEWNTSLNEMLVPIIFAEEISEMMHKVTVIRGSQLHDALWAHFRGWTPAHTQAVLDSTVIDLSRMTLTWNEEEKTIVAKGILDYHQSFVGRIVDRFDSTFYFKKENDEMMIYHFVAN